MLIKKFLFLFVLAQAAFGQYQWYSGSWSTSQSNESWNAQYTNTEFTNGEVRTTLNGAGGTTHYHLFNELQYSNPESSRFLRARLYYDWTFGWRVEVSTYDGSNTTVISNNAISGSAGAGSVFSTVYFRFAGPNGQSAGLYVRLGNTVQHITIPSMWASGSYGYRYASGTVQAGSIDPIAPNALSGLNTSQANGTLSVTWNASADDANGIGGVMYEVYRNSTLLGTTNNTSWTMAVGPGEQFTLSVKPIDAHYNQGAAGSTQVTGPPLNSGNIDDSRRVGIHSLAPQWGALGESIDMRSMNLNYMVPLVKPVGRNGVSAPIALSYNSQLWRKDGSTIYKLGADVGYGFGWRLMAGSVVPIYSGSTLLHYLFTDASGAEYKLDVNASGVWSGKEGIYVSFNSNTNRLEFTDGSTWLMDCVSGANEQDSGSRYPTEIRDRHGNYITITYRPQIGGGTVNTSARIQAVDDVRSTQASGWVTYSFTYNSDVIPHLTGITNNIATGEAYTLSYTGNTALFDPFNSSASGSSVLLQALTINGLNITQSFVHNSSGEMTRTTFPQGGELAWNYGSELYVSSRSMREVTSRDFRKASGAAVVTYSFTHPSASSLKYHSATVLTDPSGNGRKRWEYSTAANFTQGLQTAFEEHHNNSGSWVVKARTENTWAQSGSSNLYIQEALSTIDPGTAFSKQSKQVISSISNTGAVTESKSFGFGSLTTEQKKTNCSYHLYNAPWGCSTTESGVTLTLFSNGYDGGTPSALPSSPRLWTDLGNNTVKLTSTSDGLTTTSISYNKAGQQIATSGPGGSTTTTYTGAAGSIVPQTVTPNGASSLSSTMSWNGFLGLTGMTPANGNGVSFGYDSYARKTSTTSKDGAQTTYSYGSNNSWIQESVNSRWTKTYFDGIGRAVKVEAGNGGTVVSVVETVYEPCACSAVGKVKKVSLPYAPGGTVYWTEYTYDGLGRTLSVIQPNGAGTTTYLYEGNMVKVTTPSGKWKKYEMDALGRLVKVTEPRPGGGTYDTTYLYNSVGKLKQVIMPRDGVTQNRYFNYDTTAGKRLISVQNPENGTVTFQYNSDGTMSSKTDAKGIRTEYSYDSQKRVTQLRKLPNGSTENLCERIDFYYDENGGYNSGRLTRSRWGWDGSGNACSDGVSGFRIGFEETYAYNAAGRVPTKGLAYQTTPGTTRQLVASWTYDNEGKLVSESYPARSGQAGTSRSVEYTYDAMARLQRVRSGWDGNTVTYQDVASNAVYNGQGGLTSLNILGSTETRQYNPLGQLTRIIGLGIDLEYRFSATQNDGKVTQQKDWVSGEEVSYQYDELERLSSAATTSNAWGLSWSFDGFGNRLSQSLTKGTGPINSTLVDGNTNRISSAGYSYDANGNMTNMPQQNAQMIYDSSNRMVRFQDSNGTEGYQYAPDNKRVWKSAGCTWYNPGNGIHEPRPQLVFYSVFGKKMGEYCVFGSNAAPVTAAREYVYFGGRMVGRTGGSGSFEVFRTDRLQSNQDAPGGGFFPYGETKSSGTMTGESFATYTREAGGLDYADQRWYASGLGRFGSTDPYDGSFRPSHPQSANRFSYVDNEPINSFDPTGLISRDGSDNGDRRYFDSTDPGICYAAGGLFCGGGGSGGGYTPTDPQSLARSYGIIGPGQTLTAGNVDWGLWVIHLNATLEQVAMGMTPASTLALDILEAIVGPTGSITATYGNSVAVAVPVIIGGGVLIDAIGFTITFTLAVETIKELIRRTGIKRRNPKWNVHCSVHQSGTPDHMSLGMIRRFWIPAPTGEAAIEAVKPVMEQEMRFRWPDRDAHLQHCGADPAR
jgi:RHS repeat-associated protein